MKKSNRPKLKECPECKGSVMQHFDTCPHCGTCQSQRCADEDKRLGAFYDNPIKHEQEKTILKDQGYGNM